MDGRKRLLLVHRKGATRAFGPGPDLPAAYLDIGQLVLIGGGMGTESYCLPVPAGHPGWSRPSVRPVMAQGGR